jgi:hypothetical protein
VNVDVFSVAGFIGSLNVAAITCVIGTCVAPFKGETATTAGGAKPGACSTPHPAERAAARSVKIQIARADTLLICFSYRTGGMALRRGALDTLRVGENEPAGQLAARQSSPSPYGT